MTPIKLVQYADELKELHFVQYENYAQAFLYLNDETEASAQLRSWIAAGNTVAPFVPIISGGVIPVATIMWFCSPRPPEGYLLCDGSAVRRSEYAQLFRAIGTTYGEGDGASTFNLPDLVGRFCRGWGPVSPLDPNRQFGSYQQDGVGIHNHGLQPLQHTHTITDPGHIHGVTDPGHIHDIIDPGHNHSVTDPGHKHRSDEFTHTGWADFFSRSNTGLLRMNVGELDPYYRSINFKTSFNYTNMVVATDPANLFLDVAQSNVTTSDAFTNVTIDVAETNIPYTEVTGLSETRPNNVALLPVIRF
jgi:microcystin-dependent protein